jgi:hypothetical protein
MMESLAPHGQKDVLEKRMMACLLLLAQAGEQKADTTMIIVASFYLLFLCPSRSSYGRIHNNNLIVVSHRIFRPDHLLVLLVPSWYMFNSLVRKVLREGRSFSSQK